ncbi:hypothetical protein [Hyphomicrobium sulfonivorans]|uniref:hypothetical protein n=1 Tax=Hyphomicrobium sulfonivorans TaxID=121290 RepID=UPI00156F54BE|nr:hypothetical protein [Hyphomicrobium sulfonivorans]MBI1650711.1 hypothetical protein [Hyphomicrobium sulfonivorans]NSL71931.1 hypothetical protein [Hyphomicrobium sulfonivorans]
MRPGEWIKPSLLALVILVAGDAPLVATPLDKAACSALVSELETLVSTGLRDDIERGPEWAKKNLPDERVRSALRLLEIEDQIEFRCHKRYWPARPEQTAIPLPQRAPASIRPRIAQPADKPLSPPNIGAENTATDNLIAPQPATAQPAAAPSSDQDDQKSAGKGPAAQPPAPATLSASTDAAIKVPAHAPELAPLVSAPEADGNKRDKAKKSTLPPESLTADRAKKLTARDGDNPLTANTIEADGLAPEAASKPAEARAVRGFKPAAVKVPAAKPAQLARLVVADDPFIEVPSLLGSNVEAVGTGPGAAAKPQKIKPESSALEQHDAPLAAKSGPDKVELPVTKPAALPRPTAGAVPAPDAQSEAATGAAKAKQPRRRSAGRGYVSPDEVSPYALPGMRF